MEVSPLADLGDSFGQYLAILKINMGSDSF